jgi:hypothetical protein
VRSDCFIFGDSCLDLVVGRQVQGGMTLFVADSFQAVPGQCRWPRCRYCFGVRSFACLCVCGSQGRCWRSWAMANIVCGQFFVSCIPFVEVAIRPSHSFHRVTAYSLRICACKAGDSKLGEKVRRKVRMIVPSLVHCPL